MSAAAPPPSEPPLAPESPQGLGDQLRVTWQTMRARYGTYLTVLLLPAVAGLLLVLVLGGLGFLVLVPALTGGGPGSGAPSAGALVAIGLVGVLGYLGMLLLAVRAGGMQTVLTLHTLEGRRPGLGELWRETTGYLGRMLVLLLLGLVALVLVLLVMTLVSGGLFAASLGLADGELGGGTATLPLLGVWLVYLVFYVALIWVSVRLTPVPVVVALERRGGMAALRRSWRLTYGHFWRTLGYSIVASLVPTVIVSVVTTLSLLVATVVVVARSVDQFSQPGFDPSTIVGPLLLATTLSYIPTVIAAILVGPFLSCFSTVYSMDLARRRASDEPATSPEGGWQPRPYPAQPQWLSPGGPAGPGGPGGPSGPPPYPPPHPPAGPPPVR